MLTFLKENYKTILIGLIFIFYGVFSIWLSIQQFNHGKLEGYTEAKAEFDAELSKVHAEAKAESDRVQELEAQLMESAKKYEGLTKSYADVKKENEKWKKQNLENAKQSALSKETVERLNAILQAGNSKH